MTALRNPDESPREPRPGRWERATCCPDVRLCDICSRDMCEDHGLQPAPSCGSHVECIDCTVDNRCRDCLTAWREVDSERRAELERAMA